MNGLYRLCLFLYPRRHRDLFAEEMLSVFEEAAADRRDLRFHISELFGLLGGAAEAWFEEAWFENAWLASKPATRVAGSAATYMPPELLEAQRRVDANIAAMVHAIANHQFERARRLSDQERIARANLTALREKYGDELGMSF